MSKPITVDENDVTPVPRTITVDASEVQPISASPLVVDESEVTPVPRKTGLLLSPEERVGTQMTAAPGSDTQQAQDARGQAILSAIGNLIPEKATPVLGWLQKHINEPLDKVGAALASGGRELGSDAVSAVTLMQHAPDYLNATVPSPYGPKPMVPSIESVASREHPIAKGVAEGVGRAVGGALDPRYLPLFAMGGGEARPILSKLLSAGFATQLGTGAAATTKDLHDNWDKYTPEQRAEMATQAGVSIAMAAAAATHAAPDVPGLDVERGIEARLPSVTPITVDASEVTPLVALKDEPVTPGPGAQNLATGVKESGSDISQLGASVKAGTQPSVADRMKVALPDVDVSETVSNLKDATTTRLSRVAAAGK